MNVITADPATFVSLNPNLAADPIALLSILGLLITFVLYARGVKGSIIIGILSTTVLAYALTAAKIGGDFMIPDIAATSYNITPLVGAFAGGLAPAFSSVPAALGFALVVFTFFFVDFFDTAGTLIGTSQLGGFLDKDGNLPEIEKPLMADAIGTTIGGILGTSTVTTYIESATGIEEGGRTGMTALVVGILFLLSLAVVPLAAAVPLYASHVALVIVAILMLRGVSDIDWKDVTVAVPAGLTILIMPFTFSIAYGIAAGLISYPIVKAAKEGSLRAATLGQWALAAAFVIYIFVMTSGRFF
jgi:AGZA family xanthine/uracil permease-like MFS transporter